MIKDTFGFQLQIGKRYCLHHEGDGFYHQVVEVEQRGDRLAFVSAWDQSFFAWCDSIELQRVAPAV